VSPVEEQLAKFEMRKLDREIEKKNARLADGEAPAPPMYLTFHIHMGDLKAAQDKQPVSPPVLEGMTRGFERLLDEQGLLEILDEDLRKEQGEYRPIRMKMDPQEIAVRMARINQDFRPKSLSTMAITEAFMVYFKVAMMTGFVLSSPWVFYHVWAFVAAGLYPSEKKLVNVYLPFSLFLFLAGVILCQFAVMPRAIAAMLWFNEWLGLDADLRLNEWLSFALMMPLVFGLSFQTPLVMMFLHKIGLLTVQTFREKRRIAWMVMAVFAALITPTPDAMSMLFLWVPMGALYELGILLCVYQGEAEEELADWEKEERARGELVEV
jgi:Tat protein translocase TatC